MFVFWSLCVPSTGETTGQSHVFKKSSLSYLTFFKLASFHLQFKTALLFILYFNQFILNIVTFEMDI